MERENLDSRKVGRILGVDVGVVGPMTAARSYELPSGLSVQVQDAEPILRGWAHAVDPEHACDLIASISAVRLADLHAFRDELSRFELDGTLMLRDYQLAFVLRTILSERPRRTRTRRLIAAELAQLCSMVTYLRPTCDSHLQVPGASAAFFVRMAYQQFWDQEDLAGAWTRGAIVLRRMNELMPETARYDINGAFKKLHGIELTAFTFLTFGLYALATQQPGRRFDEANLLGSGEFRLMQTRYVRSFNSSRRRNARTCPGLSTQRHTTATTIPTL